MEDNKPIEENALEDSLSMEGYDKPVRNARIILFIVAAMQLFALTYSLGNLPDDAKVIFIAIDVFIAGIFIGLAFWTKRKPYTAILTALIFYCSLLILDGILNPATIMQGFILKLITIILLIVAIGNSKDVQRWYDIKNKKS